MTSFDVQLEGMLSSLAPAAVGESERWSEREREKDSRVGAHEASSSTYSASCAGERDNPKQKSARPRFWFFTQCWVPGFAVTRTSFWNLRSALHGRAQIELRPPDLPGQPCSTQSKGSSCSSLQILNRAWLSIGESHAWLSKIKSP